MPVILQRFSFLNYLLIFSLLIAPQNLWGRSSGPIQQKLKLKIAVVELHDGRVKPETVEKVTDTVRDELNLQQSHTVLSKEETHRFFETNPNLLHSIDQSNPLNRYLDQAKEFYKTFAFKDAIGVLENTIDTYKETVSVRDEHFSLTDAYIWLGNIYLGEGNKKKAQESFREAVRLAPQNQITEMQYPPKTVRSFQKAREEFLKKAKSVKISVQSSPSKGQIFINGIHYGETPLKIPHFTEGEHFIWIKKEGYQSLSSKVQVKPDGFREKFSLKKIGPSSLSNKGINVSNPRDIPELVRLANSVGNSMGVDKLVLVSVEEIGWNHKITARMVDMKYRASHKDKSVEVLNLPKDTRSAAQLIVKDLNEKTQVDLARNPKKYADSEVIVIGKKKKKSFLKSPILWSLLGVLVAGGATTAVLLSRGGGGGDNQSSVTVTGAAGRIP